MLPRFYPILDLDLALSRGHDPAALAGGLAGLGVDLIQIRGKRLGGGDLLRWTDEVLRAVSAGRRGGAPRIIVNDRADVACLAGAAGVHLGQDDLPPAAARELLGAEAVIGFSTHSPAQWAVAARDFAGGAPGACRDYLALGPIFATQSKANPDPVIGLEAIRQVRGDATRATGDGGAAATPGEEGSSFAGPLAVIGGITLENCAACWSAGADAVAVIAGWLAAPDPLAAAAQFQTAARGFSLANPLAGAADSGA